MTSSNVPFPHPSQLPAGTAPSSADSAGDHLPADVIMQSISQIDSLQPRDIPVDVGTSSTASAPPRWRFTWAVHRTLRNDLPRYRLPLSVVGAAFATSLRNRQRNIRADTARLVASMPTQPIVYGSENLPRTRPFVILPNHYERVSGAWVGWGAIVITNAVCREIQGDYPMRWVMTSTWQDCYIGPRRVNPKYLHWVLRRLANLYGIILMPADDDEAFGRGAALRDLFRALSDQAGQIVAFHPEAGGFETMIEPPKGMGRVLAMLDRRDILMVPAGVFESDGRITVRFGPVIQPGSLRTLGDHEAAERVMLRIASLVNKETRGVYAEVAVDLEASRAL